MDFYIVFSPRCDNGTSVLTTIVTSLFNGLLCYTYNNTFMPVNMCTFAHDMYTVHCMKICNLSTLHPLTYYVCV